MVSGPLALVGGEELKRGNEPQDEVLVRAAGEGPAFVLATATARMRPGLAVANARRWFGRLDLEVEELPVRERPDAESAELADRAKDGRFFYLVGGDPGHTVEVLRGSPVWESIVGAWRSGAALGGSSAGAMAMGEWTLLPGDSDRRYAESLGLVPRLVVLPHFTGFGRSWIEGARTSAPKEDVVLAGIDERTGAVWDGKRWRAMGRGGVTVMVGTAREYSAGGVIEGLPDPLC